MLRRLGRLGLPRRNPDVCRGAVGDAGLPCGGWAGGRRGRQRARARSPLETEDDDDHAGTTPRALTWSGLLALLGLSATLLPLSPTWAQWSDDQEKPAAGPEERSVRDADPQPERQRDTPDAPKTKREIRVLRRDGDVGKEASEVLDKVLAELEELTARKVDGELDRALVRLRDLVRRHASDAEPGEGNKRGDADRVLPKRPKPAAANRAKPDAADDGPEAKERRAEVAKLKAEVAERQKALMEAHMRLAKAMRQLAGAGPLSGPNVRTERWELRFPEPGEGPPPAREHHWPPPAARRPR